MMDARFFTSETLHERPIELADGSTHVVHFKELAIGEIRRYQLAAASLDEEVQSNAISRLISLAVADPDGKQAMTYEQACRLKPAPANKLLNAVLDVNQIGVDTAKKSSPPEDQNGSGTS